MAGLVPIEQLDVDRGDVERVRAQALANWLPPEQWSPETRAAVEEMLVAAPERIERVVTVLRGSPVKVVQIDEGLLIADQAETQINGDQGVPVQDQILSSDQ